MTEWPEIEGGPTEGRYGLYVHALFCLRRCPYCDFNVAVYRADRAAAFVRALQVEVDRWRALPWAGRVPAVSLFFGGGTPSLLPPEAVADVIAAARDGLGLAPGAEVTLEANPEGLDRARLAAFRAGGVTRLSLGVQSLDAAVLRRLGREHTADQACEAFEAARTAGFSDVSIDLLYGCPGQERAAWERTLGEALAWRPDHLSAYALTLEPGTAFGRRPPADLPDEATVVAQGEHLCQAAAAAGLERYEISNFARPGHQSRHNRLYWERVDYVGLGPGAHGALGALRYANLRSHLRYRQAIDTGGWPIERWERLTARQILGERLVLGLRLAEGIPRLWLDARFADRPAVLARLLDRYTAAGLVETRGARVALSPRGALLSDSLFAELV